MVPFQFFFCLFAISQTEVPNTYSILYSVFNPVSLTQKIRQFKQKPYKAKLFTKMFRLPWTQAFGTTGRRSPENLVLCHNSILISLPSLEKRLSKIYSGPDPL